MATNNGKKTKTEVDCKLSRPLPTATPRLYWLLRSIKKLERFTRFDEDILDVSVCVGPLTIFLAFVKGETSVMSSSNRVGKKPLGLLCVEEMHCVWEFHPLKILLQPSSETRPDLTLLELLQKPSLALHLEMIFKEFAIAMSAGVTVVSRSFFKKPLP